MTRAFLPASSNIICRNGNDILLIKRSHKAKAWPNFWAFPGGKVDDFEFFREAWLRELTEEVGIYAKKYNFSGETIIFHRNNSGSKISYFGLVDEWEGVPEICEPDLATDLAWFPIFALPSPFIPHHKIALDAILANISYQEIDFLV